MLKTQKNTRKQGDVGLGVAISYFTSVGITVCVPLTDNQDYDLVIDNDGLKKVQVKTTYAKSKTGYYIATLKTCGGNKSRSTVKLFDPTKVDLLFVFTEDKSIYLIPTDEITNVNTLTLSTKYSQYLLGD